MQSHVRNELSPRNPSSEANALMNASCTTSSTSSLHAEARDEPGERRRVALHQERRGPFVASLPALDQRAVGRFVRRALGLSHAFTRFDVRRLPER